VLQECQQQVQRVLVLWVLELLVLVPLQLVLVPLQLVLVL
jgi:hypothetical protein